jgi:hypothetical protein
MQTLKMGIEGMLTHYVPEVHSIEGVDDPDSGVDPYYNELAKIGDENGYKY